MFAKSSWKNALATVMLTALTAATPMFAQSDRGSITGTVTDTSSAVLPGVQVQVSNLGTGQVTTATSDSTGLYRVSDLAVGAYSIQFSKSGF
jgi:hypothetical protein